jgi:glycosyltransferase involved in cell wall biosynthesis
MPAVSMVVCLYRERDFLSRLLKRAEGCYDDLVVVHDGQDREDVRALVEAQGGRFFERPRKFSGDGHYIFGWQQARCDWIFRPDADEYPSPGLAEWLRGFRKAPEPDPAVSGFELIIPFWSGSTRATTRWPRRPTLIHRGRIRYIDVCEQWLIPDGRWVRVDEVLCHEPERKNFGASYLRHTAKRKRWLYATVLGLMQTPTALDCWRWNKPDWPLKWEALRLHPLRTALIRWFTSYWGNGREMIRSGEPFKPLLLAHYPLNHWITCMAFRAVRKEWARVQALGLEPGGMGERGNSPQRIFILDGPDADARWESARCSGDICWIVSRDSSPNDVRRVSEVRARVLMRLDDLLIHSPDQALWAEEFLCRNLAEAPAKLPDDRRCGQKWRPHPEEVSTPSEGLPPAASVGSAEKRKKVLIDGVIFQLQRKRPAGIYRLWASLLRELGRSPLAKDMVLLDRDGTAPRIEGVASRPAPAYDCDHPEGDPRLLQGICDREQAGLLISTYYSFAARTRSMVVLHDMIPELTGRDLNHPEWRAKREAIGKSYAYFSVSHSTTMDFRRLYASLSGREVFLTPGAVGEEIHPADPDQVVSFMARYEVRKPYFLLVGHRGLYKNAELFFKAFGAWNRRKEFEIVCTGGAEKLEEALEKLVPGTQCRVLGLPDAELGAAYTGATALVYASRYEGFGLPILEAQKCNCPVITCRNSSLGEVAGEAALFVSEDDVAGLQGLLDEVMHPDVRLKLVRSGQENARRFSWSASADKMRKAIVVVLSGYGDNRVGASSTKFQVPERLQTPNFQLQGQAQDTRATDGRRTEDSAPCVSKADGRLLVSAIVSTYKSERFIRGCLEDLERQTIAKELEIVVVDSASPENEGGIVKEFQERCGNVVYIRTQERETLYGAWNRGIRAARGRYVTSANTDDRHRADALEILVRTLEENPDVALVYADCLVTQTENETFESAHPVRRSRWPDFSASRLIEDCLVGPQPVWRREVHEEHGYFDDKMVSAGDYEFWLRIARNRKFLHVRQFLGLYLEAPTSVERANADLGRREAEEARARYREDLLKTAKAQAWSSSPWKRGAWSSIPSLLGLTGRRDRRH